MSVGRPVGGKLTESEKIESLKRIKEYQENYRQSKRPKTLSNLLKDVKKITCDSTDDFYQQKR